MKAYKGFNKDMTCRGYQFKEGETYHEDAAELCKSGFHACENPLECLMYYDPAHSEYHEVEVDELAEKFDNSDSKICGKTITIGARLDVLGICQAHFEYVKSHTQKNEISQDCSSLSAQNYSSLSAQDCSSLSARGCSSLSAQDYSSLSAQDCSSLSARDCSSLSAQDYSSLSAQNYSSLSARDYSSLSARGCSSLSAQNYSSLSAQDCSSLSAQGCSSLSARDCSSLSAQNCSSLSAQDYSSLSAQNCSSLSAGKNSVIAAFNSKAKGEMGTLIALANRKYKDGEWEITDFKAGIIDGQSLKPNTWYELKNGEFVEVKDEQTN